MMLLDLKQFKNLHNIGHCVHDQEALDKEPNQGIQAPDAIYRCQVR